jgi:glycosyltransferase involved in cell wall biosynthesis
LPLSERLPLAGGPPTVVWLFESPLHRIAQNRSSGAPLRHRASDLITRLLWKRSLRTAGHVAMGSRATEREVLELVPGLAGRTSVVYPAVAPGFAPGTPSQDRGEYVFHLASRDPRDNTPTVVEACRLAGARLVVAGTTDHTETVGRVPDEELVDLLRGAAVFVEASLYEGFGYTVLEAMACGAPVVASNVTSLPEVVGDAGLLCDPRSPAEFAAAIRSVLDSPELTARLRSAGTARAAAFSWDATADGLLAAIDRALR